jgi:uncharacterized protein
VTPARSSSALAGLASVSRRVDTKRIAILLPPSEGKAIGGKRAHWVPESGRFGDVLGSYRREVVAALAACGGGDEQLLGVGGKHLDRARTVNSALDRAPVLAASARYTGVVLGALSPSTFSSTLRRKANDSVIIVSGLLGAVGFNDPVPDYRLKMGARLAPLGMMSRWWRPRLSELLNDVLSGMTVIDLLPAEHAAAWVPDPSLAVIPITFVDRGGVVAGHDAKAAKGRFVRHLLTSNAGIERRIRGFADERFSAQIRVI